MKAIRASLFHCLDKASPNDPVSYQYIPDAGLVIEAGQVKALGPAASTLAGIASQHIAYYPHGLIVPGFIDAHVHYPQLPMIASYGEELLPWLERYTFPCELRFADRHYADQIASLFLDELLRHGTTSALVFATVHKESVDALFEQALTRNMRILSGKVLMDRHAPRELCDTPETGMSDSRALIKRWHGKGRLLYALTPRFAASCSPAQLAALGQLWNEHPSCYMQTHLAENRDEVRWVAELFQDELPSPSSYLEVYKHFGLVRERSIFAHAIHLEERDWGTLQRAGSAVCFCPSSNFFLGSGLFPYRRALEAGVPVAIGTDVGAGTSLSQLQTLNEAYKVIKLQGDRLSAVEAFYLATLGGAKALRLDDKLGNLQVGKEADFVILSKEATPLMKHRLAQSSDIEEQLFVLMMLGGERAVHATYVAGQKLYSSNN